ncbi:DUF6053 domain-containing protein [Lysobacter enzymogenes]|uniref:DUF6053 domain-containing protein n=1 Tax=Lysobacter enzymogenes TaxID=69 RepID=UPI003CCD8162
MAGPPGLVGGPADVAGGPSGPRPFGRFAAIGPEGLRPEGPPTRAARPPRRPQSVAPSCGPRR